MQNINIFDKNGRKLKSGDFIRLYLKSGKIGYAGFVASNNTYRLWFGKQYEMPFFTKYQKLNVKQIEWVTSNASEMIIHNFRLEPKKNEFEKLMDFLKDNSEGFEAKDYSHNGDDFEVTIYDKTKEAQYKAIYSQNAERYEERLIILLGINENEDLSCNKVLNILRGLRNK